MTYGGPDGELGAALRYLNQRFTMPMPELKATLTDIGTEELGHMEMIGTILYQLTKDLTVEQIKAQSAVTEEAWPFTFENGMLTVEAELGVNDVYFIRAIG